MNDWSVRLCEYSESSCILIPRIDEGYVALYCISIGMRCI